MSRKRHSNRNHQNPQLAPSDILPDELWLYIAYKLPIPDRLRFRAVCKTWTSLIPYRMPPWLILPEPEEIDNQEGAGAAEGAEDPSQPAPNPKPDPPPPRGFVCLGEQSICEWDFPELHESRCVGSSGNWIVTVHKDASLRMLNPFDRRPVYLPSVLLFDDMNNDAVDQYYNANHVKEYDVGQIRLWKVILNSSPSNWRDCVAMAIYHFERRLAFARLGDHKWTTVKIPGKPVPYVDDVIFYKGQFYAITNCDNLLEIHLDGRDGWDYPKATFVSCNLPVKQLNYQHINYLVEWLGELLMVRKDISIFEEKQTYETHKFKIYKFDFRYRKWNKVKSLGEHSLFLGLNASVSFCATDYFGLVKRNCVYFTDDFVMGSIILKLISDIIAPVGNDMGVYDLGDKSITPHFGGASTSSCLFSPPVWIVPPEKDSAYQDKYPRWSER